MSFKITGVLGKGIVLRGNDIDTDRIIPARFLKCVTFENLGNNVFYDERFDESGESKSHPLNSSRYRGASILIVNQNFGCGSSREHAPHALKNFGIKAIVGESFAGIFEDNCISIGFPVIKLDKEPVESLMTSIESHPEIEIAINVLDKSIRYNDLEENFEMPAAIHYVLTEGKWESTGTLLENKPDIEKTAAGLPYLHF